MDLLKVANDASASYLTKTAAIISDFEAGRINADEAFGVAQEMGIAPDDLVAAQEVLFKEASHAEPSVSLEKVATIVDSPETTPLEKVAAIVDGIAAGQVDYEAGVNVAAQLGFDAQDMEYIYAQTH